MVFDPPERRRRAWRWLIPLLLVIVALVALSASGAGGEAREEIAYLNEVSEQLEEISLGGDALRSVVPRLNSIDRPEFEVVIADLTAALGIALEFAEEDAPTPELFAVHSLYRLALDAWDQGVRDFGSGILAAADNPGESSPVDTVANAIAMLRSGDRLFLEMQAEVDRLEVPDPIIPFGEIELTPGSGEAVTLAVSYSLAARNSDNGLALRPGLAASQLVVVPDWQLNPDEQLVMPATTEAVFSVVVSNVGNLVSPEETLDLTLTGAGEPIVLSSPIPPLEAGEQTTIEFEPLVVEPGETYEVIAEILVSDIDANFEDNVIQVVFTVNPE